MLESTTKKEKNIGTHKDQLYLFKKIIYKDFYFFLNKTPHFAISGLKALQWVYTEYGDWLKTLKASNAAQYSTHCNGFQALGVKHTL